MVHSRVIPRPIPTLTAQSGFDFRELPSLNRVDVHEGINLTVWHGLGHDISTR
jgi:hypothetical protein